MSVGVWVCVGVSVMVDVLDAVAVEEAVGDAVCATVRVDVAVAVAVLVAVGDAVTEGNAVGVPVKVGVALLVGVAVQVLVPVGDAVGVIEAVAVLVAVGVKINTSKFTTSTAGEHADTFAFTSVGDNAVYPAGTDNSIL